jgi:superfamily II DNA or RNA helicase
MLSNFKELMASSGASLCDPVGFGKYKGKHLWEIPETYWQSFCTKNGLAFSELLSKVSEAKYNKALLESKPARRKVDPALIRDFLFPHQKEYVLRFGDMPYSNLWAAIGTGKTYAYLELVRHKIRVGDKCLVINPKGVFSSWNESVLDYLGAKATYINLTGSTDEKIQRLSYDRYFYITNYESLLNEKLLAAFINKGFSFVVFDEAHKVLCNVKTKTWKHAFALTANVEIKQILTGTPRKKSELNLYGLITMLDRGERFGASFYAFREKYFNKDYMGFNYSLKPELEKEFWDKVKSCSYVVPKSILNLPKLDKIIREVELTGEAKKYYEIMKKDAIIEIERFKKDKKNKIVGSIAIAKISKLRQICSGFVNDTEEGETIVFNQDKLVELESMLQDIDEPVIITAIYKEEIKQIQNLLTKLDLKFGTIAGKVSDKNREKARIDFSENNLDVIILQEQAGGAGINKLQNYCKLMIRYSYGYSFDDEDQVIGRMERQGQKEEMRMIRLKTVLGDGKETIEKAIIEAIEDKSQKFQNLIDIVSGKL